MRITIILLSLFLIQNVGFTQEIFKNPKKPLSRDSGRVVQLEEKLRIKDLEGRYYFKNPNTIRIHPDGSIFVLDEEQFLEFDKNGQYIRNFFRKGQGPGEFERIQNFIFTDEQIVIFQNRPQKIVILDRSGKLVKEIKPEDPVSRLITLYGDKFIMAKSSFPNLEKPGGEAEIIEVNWNLWTVSGDGETEAFKPFFPVKWIAKRLEKAIIANFIVDFTVEPFKERYLVLYHTQDYLIKLYDLEHNQIVRSFSRKYKSVRRKPVKSEKKEVRPNTFTLEIPAKHYNDIQRILIRKDKIWAFTSTVSGEKGVLVDVFDEKGFYLDSFFLPVDKYISLEDLSPYPICVSGDFLYIVEKDENSIPSIVKYKIIL